MTALPVADEPEIELPIPLDFAELRRNGIPPTPWIAEPYLVEQEMNLWIGDGFTGKSMLALDVAVGLASGTEILFGAKVSRPYRVMIMDEDGGPLHTGGRIIRLAEGRNVIDQPELFQNLTVFVQNGLNVASKDSRDKIHAILDKYKPEILILDALRAFHTANENNSDEMAILMRHIIRPLAKRHGILATILLHHTSKDIPGQAGRSTTSASRGSTEIRNAPDIILHLTRVKGFATLAMEKARNLSEHDRPGPVSFEVVDTPNRGLLIKQVEEARILSKVGKAKVEIEVAFRANPMSEFTHADLVSRLPGVKKREFAAQTVHNALIQLDGSFLVSRKDPGHVNRVLYRMV